MASEAKLQISLNLDDNASKELEVAAKNVDNFAQKTKNLEPVFKGAATIGTAGFVAIAGAVGLSVKNYAEAERATRQLEHAIIDVSKGSMEQAKAISEATQALEDKAGVDADALKTGAAQLATFGLQAESVVKLTKSLADLTVNQNGVNASADQYVSSANTIAKALNGQFGVLEKMGIRFTEAQQEIINTGNESEKVATIILGLNQNLRETTDTIGGIDKASARLSRSIGSVSDGIAKAFTPVLVNMADKIIPVVQSVAKWIEANPKLTATIVSVVAGIFALVGIVGTLGIALVGLTSVAGALGITLAATLGWIIAIPLAIAGLIAAGVLLYKNWDKIKEVAREVWGEIVEFFSSVWDDITSGIKNAWDSIVNFLSGIWNAIVEFGAGIWAGLVNSIKGIFEGLRLFFTAIWDGIKTIFEFGASFLAGFVVGVFQLMGIDIVKVFNDLKAFFITAWTELTTQWSAALEIIKNLWDATWNGISSFFSNVWQIIVSNFKEATNQAASIWETTWQAIKDFIDPILAGIQTIINSVFNWIINIFNTILKPLASAWDALWTGMGNVVKSVFESVKSIFTSSINWIIDKINILIEKINSVAKTGGKVIGIEAPQIPSIPRLATGGIVTRPTIAMIGEAGPEAIIPLSGGLAGAGAGLGGFNIYINGNNFYGEDDLADKVSESLMRSLKGNIRLN